MPKAVAPSFPFRPVSGLVLLSMMTCLSLFGCGQDGSEQTTDAGRSAAAIQLRLADAFVNGTTHGTTRIKAERFDPLTQMLHQVQVTTKDLVLAAERAEIRINLVEDTGQLILLDVVTATFGPDSTSPEFASGEAEGTVETFDRLELDPFPLSKR